MCNPSYEMERRPGMQLIRLFQAVTPLLVAAVAVLTAFADSASAAQPDAQRPPIPVRFRLDEPAYVMLVIERAAAGEPDGPEGVRRPSGISDPLPTSAPENRWSGAPDGA